MQESNLWFTHVDEKWDVDDDHRHVKFTGNKKTWNWNNCFFSAIKEQEKIKITVRSFGYVQSKLNKTSHQINFEYDFKISEIPKPTQNTRQEPLGNTNEIQYSESKHTSYELILQKENELDSDKKTCVIWEWLGDLPLEETNLYKVYKMLQEVQQGSSDKIEKKDNIIPFLPFSATLDQMEKVLPIIYQPAIDTLKNFIRQIHIFKVSEIEYEITIIFNNEELRNNKIFQKIYDMIRPAIYGRTKDVESFRILLDPIPKQFTFEGIYSQDYDIRADTIHGDKKHWWCFGGPKKRPILYFYSDNYHPKVFVNTSNHAMAPHDNNPNLWKWEYITWADDSPIEIGNKCRKDIDAILNDFNETLRVNIIESEILKSHKNDLEDIDIKKYQNFAEHEFLVDSKLAKRLVMKAINNLRCK